MKFITLEYTISGINQEYITFAAYLQDSALPLRPKRWSISLPDISDKSYRSPSRPIAFRVSLDFISGELQLELKPSASTDAALITLGS